MIPFDLLHLYHNLMYGGQDVQPPVPLSKSGTPMPIEPMDRMDQVRALVREMETAIREVQRLTNAPGAHS
jgi:hypothetical protein